MRYTQQFGRHVITSTTPQDEERDMTEYMQVLTTVDSGEEAERLARSITTARLAACVQIVGPIRSVYWWHDAVEDAQEWQLLIKTTTGRLAELEQHIKANHSYETPEIIATEIPWGSREYLGWVTSETRQADASS
jgi:periplasmic divalent cation tolerance protein